MLLSGAALQKKEGEDAVTTKVINAHPHGRKHIMVKLWQHRHLYLMLIIPVLFYVCLLYTSDAADD